MANDRKTGGAGGAAAGDKAAAAAETVLAEAGAEASLAVPVGSEPAGTLTPAEQSTPPDAEPHAADPALTATALDAKADANSPTPLPSSD